MSEAEYTINHDIDGWPICKNGEPIFDNKTMLAELHSLQALVKELELERKQLASKIHYPDCWDTAVYPTLPDALQEIGCNPDCCTKQPQGGEDE